MLNIPDTVKALFKLDNIKKNFRVQFPNGEYADLTNDDIVLDSVKFTESICSTDTFRFGLAESSVIEFETVGVGNMRGMTIKCSCEICIDSLTTAQKNEIKSYNGDGEYYQKPAATAQGWEYYRVPYGVFVVSECPRNSFNPVHRRVVAYTPAYFTEMNPYELTKTRLRGTYTDAENLPHYTPDAALLVYGQLAYLGDGVLLSEGFTKTQVATYTSLQLYPNHTFPTFEINGTDGVVYSFELRGIEAQGLLAGNNSGGDEILGVSGAGTVNYDDWVQQIKAAIQAAPIRFPTSAYNPESMSLIPFFSINEFVETLVTSRFYVNGRLLGSETHFATRPYFWVEALDTTGGRDYEESIALDPNIETTCVYPGGRNDPIWTASILFPRSFDLRITNKSTSAVTVTQLRKTAADFAGRTFWRYIPPASLPLLGTALDFAPKTAQYGGFNYLGTYDMAGIVAGFLELRAEFAAPKRNGGVKVFRLLSSAVENIAKSQYGDVWWDEYIQRNIGSVRYTFKELNQEYTAEVRFGRGMGVYSMEGNAMLEALNLSQTEIADLIYSNFAVYANSLNLNDTEVEDMQAMPYLESGDLFTLAANDGETVNVYITRQTYTGELFPMVDLQEVGNTVVDRQEASV